MERQKEYEKLTIRDHFMFGKICSKAENRKLILDALLQIDLKEKDGAIEKQIREFKDAKYARLDLLVEDVEGAVYDAEMQNKSNDRTRQLELPKRSRYYQSVIDTTHFNSGGDYMKLPESYVIFICTYDPFGKGLPIYTFSTKCNEVDLPEYDDLTHKIFFNTTADLSGLPQNMRNMLSYINTGAANDEATEVIDNEVKEARLKEEWKAEYMLTLVHDKDVYREGAESRQPEVDALNSEVNTLNSKVDSLNFVIQNKDSEIEYLKKQIEELKK